MSSKPYIIELTENVLPGAVGGNQMSILIPNANFQLRALYLDVQLMETAAPFNVVPESNNTRLFWELAITTLSGLPMGGCFERFADPLIVSGNGERVRFTKSGKYIFDTLFSINELIFNFNIANRDALLAYTYITSIVAEITTV